MLYEHIILSVTLFIALLLSCLLSACETAFTGCSKARLHYLSQNNNKSAKRLLHLLEKQDITIGCLLLGNNLVNILSSALVTDFFIQEIGEGGIAYATFVMTIIIFVFAEMLPKNYALRHADSLSLSLSWFIATITFLGQPFVALLRFLTRKMQTQTTSQEPIGEEILRGTIDLHKQNEEFIETGKMLASVLDLENITIREVMKHRSQLSVIDLTEDNQKTIIQTLSECPGSFIVVTDNNETDILGLLLCKDALLHIYQNPNSFDLRPLIKDDVFALETTSLLEQIQQFKRKKIFSSIVVDEYGEFLGLVTQTDILEEIVGNMNKDPHKTILPGVVQQGSSYFIAGDVTLRDLNRALDWNLLDDQASTIAGLLLYKTKTIPDVHQTFTFDNLLFEVIEKNETAITQVKVTPHQPL